MTREQVKKRKRVRKKPKFKPREPKKRQPRYTHSDIDWSTYPEEKIERIKQRRTKFLNQATVFEKRLYKALKEENIPYAPQYPIIDKEKIYFADCLVNDIIIELDGGYHKIHYVYHKDMARTKRIEAKGYRVMRFENQIPTKEIIERIRGAM